MSACGAATAASKQAEQAAGVFAGPQGRTVLVVNPGVASPERLNDDLDPIISTATKDGAHVRAFVLNGGSAAAMIEIAFSDMAGQGNFFPPGRNSGAWNVAAATFKQAALADLQPALVPNQTQAATGADLAGALVDALAVVRKMPGAGPLQVVIDTGGGVHRTAQLDLIAAHLTPSNAASLAAQIPRIDPGGVEVEVIGVGRFEGISVNPVFAQGLKLWWADICPKCHIR